MYTELEFKDLPQEVTEGFEERVEHLKEFNFKIINVVKEDCMSKTDVKFFTNKILYK